MVVILIFNRIIKINIFTLLKLSTQWNYIKFHLFQLESKEIEYLFLFILKNEQEKEKEKSKR